MKRRRAGLLALALLLAPAVRAAERTETLAVGGWHSKGDAYKTELALRGVKGVTNVSSDKDKGTVTVTYDDAQTNRARLEKAIAEAGYSVGR